jgi:calcium-dependent protein kinase
LTAEEAVSHPWLNEEDADAPPVDAAVLDSLKRFNAESKFKQAVCALMARELNAEVQRNFEENFAKLDTNKDGTVTVQELREAIIQMVRFCVTKRGPGLP